MTEPRPQRRRARLLVLGRDPELIAALDEAVGAECELEIEPDAERAIQCLAERPYAGAIIDAQAAGAWLHAACNGYLERQPIGRVVIVTSSEDPATLMRLAVQDARVEVLFAPAQAETLSEALFGERGTEEIGESTRGRRTMRWLLARS